MAGEAKRPAGARLLDGLKGLGEGLLTFLEIIGLRQERSANFEARLSRIKHRYFHFRDLLTANNDLLETISEMEVRLASDAPVTAQEVRARTLNALTCAHRMVSSFSDLSGAGQAARSVLARLQQRISACLETASPEEDVPAVLPMDRLEMAHAGTAGHKMAALGEIRRKLGLPVPDGFAITTTAFKRTLGALGAPGPPPAGPGMEEQWEAHALRMQALLLRAALPEDLEREILEAYRGLSGGGRPPVAVRSSALEEDEAASFAGQYLTLLNVGEPELLAAYRRVLASAYEPELLFYRKSFGFADEDAQIAVGCMVMVDALASGVAFSRDPRGGAADKVLIHAVWGLGPSLADGTVNPDVYLVPREGDRPEVQVQAFRKTTRTVGRAGGGVADERVPEDMQLSPPLTEDEARALARWAMKLEAHFGAPQDLEWAMDRSRRLFLLQSRPSTGASSGEGATPPPEGAEVLLEGGDTAAPGAGAGPVFIPDEEGRLGGFPEGGVLVVRHSSPRYVRVMKKASAIVANVGSAIGHMASLSREFGIPTLVGAEGATLRLRAGDVVTVDATGRRVYAGRVESILARPRPALARAPRSRAAQSLHEVARFIVPLTLTDPSDPGFTALNCRSLHDLARYLHERSFGEMFGIGRMVGDDRLRTPLLDVFLPVDLYVIDLGGGLAVGSGVRRVRRDQILSPPFAAMVDGMLHKDIPRYGPRSMDAKGFLHVVMRQAMADPEYDSTLRDPCYAIISDRYVNMAARVGFHFSVLDAYCCEEMNQNYVTFRFKGGAADEVRRVRRVQAIAQILKELGFTAGVTGDLVAAHYVKRDMPKTLKAVKRLGCLLQFMRQMDAAMTSDHMVGQVVSDFLSGAYCEEPPPGEGG